MLVDKLEEDETCLEWGSLGSAPFPLEGTAELAPVRTRRGPVDWEHDTVLPELTRVDGGAIRDEEERDSWVSSTRTRRGPSVPIARRTAGTGTGLVRVVETRLASVGTGGASGGVTLRLEVLEWLCPMAETLRRRLSAVGRAVEALFARSFTGAAGAAMASAAFSSASLLRLTMRKPATGGGATAAGRAFLGVASGVGSDTVGDCGTLGAR